MASNFEPVTLTWEDINVYAPVPEENPDTVGEEVSTKQKHILKHVYGSVEPGTLLAIIGASGAGKTTLLNLLNGRNQGNLKLEGSIKINGHSPTKGFASFSAYVQQDDMFIGTITVREHLWVQAMLRMDKALTKQEKVDKIEEVIRIMSLTDCADTVIGLPGIIQGISGGERKKLAFASAVLTNPALLCCDEPTSGVDSFVAQSVVRLLRRMAEQGRTILCTIHQPSSEVFAMFDKVLIMAEGRTAFLGDSADALQFFASCGYVCPATYNPADHYIHTLAVVPGRETECKQVVKYISHQYVNTTQSDNVKAIIATTKKRRKSVYSSDDDIVQSTARKSPYKASFGTQFQAMFWRCMKSQLREPAVFRNRFLPTIGIAIFVSLVYWNQEYTQTGVNNINGALYNTLIQVSFNLIGSVVLSFPKEYPIFIKEHYDGMYRVDVYFWSKTLSEIPQFLAVPMAFMIPVYWGVGLKDEAGAFFMFLLVGIIIVQVSSGFGYFLSCCHSDMNIIVAITVICIIPIMLLGGTFLADDSIPVYMIWLKYMSWFPFSYEILLVNQWQGVTNITCAPGETGCYENGSDVITAMGYHEDRMAFDFSILIVQMIVYRLAAFALMFARAYRRHVVHNNEKKETSIKNKPNGYRNSVVAPEINDDITEVDEGPREKNGLIKKNMRGNSHEYDNHAITVKSVS